MKNKVKFMKKCFFLFKGSGEIMISCLGNAKGELPGGFALLNENFEVIGRWNDENNPPSVQFYYDFWYKPRS